MDFLTREGPDKFKFEHPFQIEGKADTSEWSSQLEDGDLLIEGWAAKFEGEDREGENFTDGAFGKAISAFMDAGSPLCYHHKTGKCLGKVLELDEVPGKGLHMVARVDGSIQTHPELGTYYNQIKKGTFNKLSVGGIFRRKMTPDGPRIGDMDFTEISVTPVPVHTAPAFSVIAGKALSWDDDEAETNFTDEELKPLGEALDKLSAVLEGKAVEPKGDYRDLHCLALILELERLSRQMPENDGDEVGGKDSDAKVDALVTKTREALHEIAKEAHSLAAKLGPLPKISWAGSEPY